MLLVISIEVPKGEKHCNGKRCCRFFSDGSEPACYLFNCRFKGSFYLDTDGKAPLVFRCDECVKSELAVQEGYSK